MNNKEICSNLKRFSKRWHNYNGNEISEAQTFCNDFFNCFGLDRKEVGAKFESKIELDSTRADLVWGEKLLIEMKRPSELNFERHYEQVYKYWLKINPSPKYVLMCNFNKIEIHDPFKEYGKPLVVIPINDIHIHTESFAFMIDKVPFFPETKTEITKQAAESTIKVYHSLLDRYSLIEVRVFILQCVFAMFAEHIKLLPRQLFTNILRDCLSKDEKTGDLVTLFFQRLNYADKEKRRGRDIPYFNGGLFKDVNVIDLTSGETNLLLEACSFDWSKIRPEIFGTLFEASMTNEERSIKGAHYTSELDIQRIIVPTIIQPWKNIIDSIESIADVEKVKKQLFQYKVLDPACGSGNFLYIAYREIKQIEFRLLAREKELLGTSETNSRVHPIFPINNIYGFDKDEFAVMLARVTLWIGQQMVNYEYGYNGNDLPLPDLSNINCSDSLFNEWPREIHAYIGNPPFIGAKRMRTRLSDEYVNALFEKYPKHNKLADYCTYFFHRIHEEMKQDSRAGLVGTNTIRENNTRNASLDFIVKNNGCIYNAWSSYEWSGNANVHVSIVNWMKGKPTNQSVELNGDNVAEISSRLVSEKQIKVISKTNHIYSKLGYIGINPRGKGFILSVEEAQSLLNSSKINIDVIKPYLKARSLQSNPFSKFDSYIIDFGNMEQEEAETYPDCYKIIKDRVRPQRLQLKDCKDNYDSKTYWWQFHKKRNELRSRISNLDKYIAVARHSKKPIFTFIKSNILPGDSLVVIASSSEYLLGILSSRIHAIWAEANCSSLKGDLRYTPTTVLETFPFPFNVPDGLKSAISSTMQNILNERYRLMEMKNIGLTKLYNAEYTSLSKLHRQLDIIVQEAYKFPKSETLPQEQIMLKLLDLNNRR